MPDSETEPVPSVDQLSSLKLKDLKDRCRTSGLPVTGSKKDLVERLHKHLVAKAEEESLLLSDDALLGDGDNADNREKDSEAGSNNGNNAESPPVPDDSMDAADVEPTAEDADALTPEAASQSEAAPEIASQSEPATEVGSQSESDTKPVSQSEPAPVAANQSEQAAGKPISATGLSGLSDAERRELRAKRFGVTSSPATTSATTTHPEMESRKRARAERFGDSAAYSEPKPGQARGARLLTETALSPGDLEKMRKRSERFGCVTSPALKRAEAGAGDAKPEEADKKDEGNVAAAVVGEDEAPEAAKKRARAARFATPQVPNEAVAASDEATK